MYSDLTKDAALLCCAFENIQCVNFWLHIDERDERCHSNTQQRLGSSFILHPQRGLKPNSATKALAARWREDREKYCIGRIE